jgi:hypothetical protein
MEIFRSKICSLEIRSHQPAKRRFFGTATFPFSPRWFEDYRTAAGSVDGRMGHETLCRGRQDDLSSARTAKQSPQRAMNNFGEKVNFLWSIAELLRDRFKRGKYQDVILPFTVLRRIDCVYGIFGETVRPFIHLLSDKCIANRWHRQ